MESAGSKAVKWLLRLSGAKAVTEWTDGDALSWAIRHNVVWDAEIPGWLGKRHRWEKLAHGNMTIYHFLSRSSANNKYIYYLHGGGFIIEIYFLYWLFIHRLLQSTDAVVRVPIYPLLPKVNFEGAFSEILGDYISWSDQLPDGAEISIVADSSGAALGLRLAQELKKQGKVAPDNIVLISPWIDMQISDEEMKDYENLDSFLSVDALKYCASMFVPNEDYASPLYSPLYGELDNIGKITVFTGTGDLLYVDALNLKQRADRLGVSINYYEHKGMFHIYPHFPVREGIAAFKTLIDILNNDSNEYSNRSGFVKIFE